MRRLVALSVCLSVIATVAADDWPQWLGPERDGVWRESGGLEKVPAGGPKVLWRAKVGAGFSGPGVAGGKVFVADRVVAPGAKNHSEQAFPQRPKDSIAGSERVL